MERLPLVSPLDRVLFLKAQPYLAELPSTSLAALAQYTEEEFYGRQQPVFDRGVRPEKIYFLASGGVRVQYAGGRPFDITAPGGVGLVEHLARSEEPPGVFAIDETLALSLDVSTFMQIIEDDFALFTSIAGQLARNLAATCSTLGAKPPPEHGFAEHRLGQTFASLDLVHRLSLAREAPLFRGSNLTVLTELLRFQEPRVLQAGESIFVADTPVESMALVLDGSFVARCAAAETLHPAGSMLGGWDIFGSSLRRDTAEALTPARVIEIDRRLFIDVLEDHFEFAVDYLGKLCRRLIELRTSLPDLEGPE